MKCPGQDSLYWNADAIYEVPCPGCDSLVEFFKDDTARTCPNCGHRFVNPHLDFGCAAYCQFGEQCVGTLPQEFPGDAEELLKRRVAREVKHSLEKDFKKIAYISQVARYAERICLAEGAHLAVVLCSSYLHAFEGKSKMSDGQRFLSGSKNDGETLAKILLGKLGAPHALQEEVLGIIENLKKGKMVETRNYLVVHDAITLARLEGEQKEGRLSASAVQRKIDSYVLTAGGRFEATKILLREGV